jgi:hypothetical protein
MRHRTRAGFSFYPTATEMIDGMGPAPDSLPPEALTRGRRKP